MTVDLLVTGGTVVDPATGRNGPDSVAIAAGRIVALHGESPPESRRTIDASGKLVLPGLVDLHAHVFAGYHGTDADPACLARGTTTVADGGSSGANAFELFRATVVERVQTRVRAWLNISTIGLIDIRVGELLNLLYLDVDAAVATVERHPGIVVGLKIRISEYVAGGDFHPALRLALAAAEAAGVPLLVHIGETNQPLALALDLLRPGDVVTHAYTGRRHGILDAGGSILPEVHAARARGVRFDGAHGRRHFGFEAIRRAVGAGFLLDTLSTDISSRAVRDPAYHLPLLMSKLMALGVAFDDLVPMVTVRPAERLGLAGEAGTLAPGAAGDVAILELIEEPATFVDSEGATVTADRRLRPWLTVRAGEVVEPPPGA